ncbi:MAG: hypothetical protein H6746_01875 [Deltaproteobacteria bacterium]|nr:hypothetical protein [Deltaproteobacteria bacterium]
MSRFRGLQACRILATCALLLAVAGTARAEWLSPGPLAKDHKALDVEASCERCHVPGGRVSQDRCLGCHTEVAIPLQQKRGFHTKLITSSGKACESCHSDHKGRDYPLIRWTPPAAFDHGKETGFELAGAHAAANCGSCHKDRPRYMGLKTACASCHEDVHRGQLGADCANCHTVTAFRPASGFSHARTDFPLVGKHEDVACASCHSTRPDGAVAYALKGFKRCSSCHEDPHRGRTSLSPCDACHQTTGWHDTRGLPPAHSPAGWPLVGKHQSVACRDCHGSELAAKVSRECVSCHADPHAGRFGKDCEACHDESGWSLRGKSLTRFDHDRTRYPLQGRHKRVDCRSCHKGSGSYAATWRGLAFDRCDRCHSRYHEGPLTTVPSATACERCHTVQGFDPSTFTDADHARATFALTGSHLAVPCASCHRRDPPSAPTPLDLAASRCADCHEDPHKGQFDKDMGDKGCVVCHSTAGWGSGGFDHDQTRLPLRGVHAEAACESCHPGAPARPYADAPHTCEGCHADKHLGQFRTEPARTCDACHGFDAWPITAFDHAERAGWPLEGKHQPLACDACHGEVKLPDGRTATQYRLGYRECRDCHANPHAGGRR